MTKLKNEIQSFYYFTIGSIIFAVQNCILFDQGLKGKPLTNTVYL